MQTLTSQNFHSPRIHHSPQSLPQPQSFHPSQPSQVPHPPTFPASLPSPCSLANKVQHLHTKVNASLRSHRRLPPNRSATVAHVLRITHTTLILFIEMHKPFLFFFVFCGMTKCFDLFIKHEKL